MAGNGGTTGQFALMKFMANIFLFVVALTASLIAAFAGIGLALGKDMGFAGAGLWYLMMPAALIGMLIAYVISRFLPKREDSFLRHCLFVFFASCISALLAYLPPAIFFHDSMLHGNEGMAYVPATDYAAFVKVTVPRFVFPGEPVSIKIERNAGPWQRMRFEEMKDGTKYFADRPGPSDPRVVGVAILQMDPPACMRLESMDPATGEGKAVFPAPTNYGGGCNVWADMNDVLGDKVVKSDIISVSIYPPGQAHSSGPAFLGKFVIFVLFAGAAAVFFVLFRWFRKKLRRSDA